MLDDLARVPRHCYPKLSADPSNESRSDLAVAWHERAGAGVRVFPGFVRSLTPGDLGAALSDEVPLEVASFQLASFNQFGGCPALAGDGFASLPS